jgi:hypothetical protein
VAKIGWGNHPNFQKTFVRDLFGTKYDMVYKNNKNKIKFNNLVHSVSKGVFGDSGTIIWGTPTGYSE